MPENPGRMPKAQVKRVSGQPTLGDYLANRKILLRSMSGDDIPELKQMVFAIYDEYGEKRLRRWYEQKHPEVFDSEVFGKNPERRVAHILEDPSTGSIVGSGILIQPDLKTPEIGEISKLYLHPSVRGQGFGRLLLEDLIRQARRMEYDELFLVTRVKFTDAIPFYRTAGFRKVKNDVYNVACSIKMKMRL